MKIDIDGLMALLGNKEYTIMELNRALLNQRDEIDKMKKEVEFLRGEIQSLHQKVGMDDDS
jgi:uncharacterized coiled-coil protein SlyX